MQIRDEITFTLKQTILGIELITDNWFFRETENYLKIVLKNCQVLIRIHGTRRWRALLQQILVIFS